MLTPTRWAWPASISPLTQNRRRTARSVCAYTTLLRYLLPLHPQCPAPSLPLPLPSTLRTFLPGALPLLQCRRPLLQSICSQPLHWIPILSLASACQTKSLGSTLTLRCCTTAPPYSQRWSPRAAGGACGLPSKTHRALTAPSENGRLSFVNPHSSSIYSRLKSVLRASLSRRSHGWHAPFTFHTSHSLITVKAYHTHMHYTPSFCLYSYSPSVCL